MSNTHLDRAKILTEALPYIQRYNGKIVVVNCGGVAMDAELRDAVATDITMLRLVGIKVVLVHGIGPEVKQALAQSGRELVQKEGVYQIGPEAMEILQEVLCGKVNKSLVATLNKLGSKSIGLCGIDGGLMTARAAEGCTGELVRVDSTILETFLAQDYTPVVAAVAQGADGGETVYSVSANLTAARLAVALKAEKLIHLVESTKLLRDPAAPRPHPGAGAVPGPRHDPQRRDPAGDGAESELQRGGGALRRAVRHPAGRERPPRHPVGAAVRRGHRHHADPLRGIERKR